MPLLTGFHYLPGGEDDPGPVLPAATFLDLAPARGQLSPERLVRLFFTGRPDPAGIAEGVLDWVKRGARVQLGNEPNLPSEGFGGGPADYAAWFRAVRARVPVGRLYWAGMSPGVPGWLDWYAEAGVADGIALHAYGTLDQMRGAVEAVLPLGRPLWLAEVNFGAGRAVDRDAWAADHLRPFLDWCATVPLVEAVTYFAWRWPTPDTPLPVPVDAAGTGVERLIRSWAPPAPAPAPEVPPVTPETNPWRGKILTVWNLPPDPGDLVAAARNLRLDGVEVKTADGASSWLDSPRRRVTRAYADALRAAGLRVLGWSYNYCDGRRDAGDRGDGVPAEEAAAAARAVAALGLEGHTFDLEIEAEGHPAEVAALFAAARDAMAVPLAAHVWGDLAGHDGYPAEEIARRADVLRPMIYRPVWTAERFWASWAPHLAGRVVCPVWGLTEGTAPALRADMAAADARGCPGEGYWEWAAVPGLAPAVRTLVAGRSFAAPQAGPDYEALAWAPIYRAHEGLLATGDQADAALAEAVHNAVVLHKLLKGQR